MEEVSENRIPIYISVGFFVSSGLCIFVFCNVSINKNSKYCKYIMTKVLTTSKKKPG